MDGKPLKDRDNYPWYPKGSIHIGLEDNRDWGNTLLQE